jgi:cytochrome oxidase assembly protein ShyY1
MLRKILSSSDPYLAGCGVLISPGFWQAERLAWKEDLKLYQQVVGRSACA